MCTKEQGAFGGCTCSVYCIEYTTFAAAQGSAQAALICRRWRIGINRKKRPKEVIECRTRGKRISIHLLRLPRGCRHAPCSSRRTHPIMADTSSYPMPEPCHSCRRADCRALPKAPRRRPLRISSRREPHPRAETRTVHTTQQSAQA